MKLFLSITPEFKLRLKNTSEQLKLKLDFNYVDVDPEIRMPHYDGSYEITPKVTAQMLETKDTIMDKNMTVKKIHYSRTSNKAGGLTIQIGDI